MERSKKYNIYLWSKSIMWKYPSKAPWGRGWQCRQVMTEKESVPQPVVHHWWSWKRPQASNNMRPPLSSQFSLTHPPANNCSVHCKLNLSVDCVSSSVCVCVCVCVCVFLCEVLVYGVHWGFWIRFFSQADSSHLGRLRSLMGFIFSLLGNFCRDTQHSEWVHCSWKQLHLSRSSHAPHLSLLILSFLTQ